MIMKNGSNQIKVNLTNLSRYRGILIIEIKIPLTENEQAGNFVCYLGTQCHAFTMLANAKKFIDGYYDAKRN